MKFQVVLHRLKGTVTMVIADNLAAHALGGFFCNFSTIQRFCRFCNCRKSQLDENLPVSTFVLRTKNAYDNNLRAVLEDPNLVVLYGIKDSSPLNTLTYFHIADALPPDLCHDLFEGFAVDVISNVIIAFIKDGFFDLDDFNDIILNFEYFGNDKNNKPQRVKKKPLNSLRVKQTACEMRTLLRLPPLMMGHLIPRGNTVWGTCIKLLQVVEILCPDEFSNSDLLLLQDEIDTFFQNYADVFQNVCVKPQGHCLQHYPAMIRRFESKNGYFKSTFQASQNRKNMCFSMATRHQMRVYLNYCNSSVLSFKESH